MLGNLSLRVGLLLHIWRRVVTGHLHVRAGGARSIFVVGTSANIRIFERYRLDQLEEDCLDAREPPTRPACRSYLHPSLSCAPKSVLQSAQRLRRRVQTRPAPSPTTTYFGLSNGAKHANHATFSSCPCSVACAVPVLPATCTFFSRRASAGAAFFVDDFPETFPDEVDLVGRDFTPQIRADTRRETYRLPLFIKRSVWPMEERVITHALSTRSLIRTAHRSLMNKGSR